MRISDWSSDVCSSDLEDEHADEDHEDEHGAADDHADHDHDGDDPHVFTDPARMATIAEGLAADLMAAVPELDTDAGRERAARSEERRGGQEGVSTCRARGSQVQ